ncbi:MAG: hypothetical protein AB7H96_09075 [Vicinamibacterales bacterium]
MRRVAAILVALLHVAPSASGQAVTQRGFVEAGALLFPQDAPRDATNVVVDLLLREELFIRPAPWLQLSAGADLRANTHDQVDRAWRIDLGDRRLRRPAIATRRLAATFTRGPVTLDVGKQFIRWGKADIVTPTDHFAPRDFINVINSEFLPVTGARGVVQLGSETIDVAWLPRFTPSRMPLIDQRWTVLPDEVSGYALFVADPLLPGRDQLGVRWGHTGSGYELSVSAFDGLNHLPMVRAVPTPGVVPGLMVARSYPRLRSVGADAAVPTRWFTLKGEMAVFHAPDRDADDYVLYVIQVERQTGEWLLLGGYAGEVVTERRVPGAFAPNRGLTRSLVARASYTIDSTRSAAVETAVRQDGAGVYVKGEFSQSRGQHWRLTLSGTVIAGDEADFLGQYRRNSNAAVAMRYSF